MLNFLNDATEKKTYLEFNEDYLTFEENIYIVFI